VTRDPFTGIGKPEPLEHLGPNRWTRRLTESIGWSTAPTPTASTATRLATATADGGPPAATLALGRH